MQVQKREGGVRMAQNGETITVDISIVCAFYTGGFGGAVCEVPADSTAREAVELCLAQAGAEFKGNITDITMCMHNGKQGKYSDTLADGDRLMILRKIYGG